jgi:ABC-type Zn uptake system ZnuABC Zn-binding protein ZnuA
VLTRNKTLTTLVIFLMFLLGMSGCSSTQPTLEPSHDKVKVFVSLLPQAYFAEKVGGDHVQVDVLIPPGADPHTYELLSNIPPKKVSYTAKKHHTPWRT